MSDQTIFRVVGPNRSYTKLSNKLLCDNRLSLACTGLLVRVLRLPTDWAFNIQWFRNEFGIGKDKVYSLIEEARERGYCNRVVHRDRSGSTIKVEYQFTDDPDVFGVPEPLPSFPEVAVEPLPAKATSGLAVSGKSGSIQKTDSNKQLIRTNIPLPPSGASPKGDRASRLPSNFVVPDAWREWAADEAPKFTALIDHEAAKFTDHWHGNGQRKIDWAATWRNWWRRSVERAPRQFGLLPTSHDRHAEKVREARAIAARIEESYR